jgi:hypothetical protein
MQGAVPATFVVTPEFCFPKESFHFEGFLTGTAAAEEDELGRGGVGEAVGGAPLLPTSRCVGIAYMDGGSVGPRVRVDDEPDVLVDVDLVEETREALLISRARACEAIVRVINVSSVVVTGVGGQPFLRNPRFLRLVDAVRIDAGSSSMGWDSALSSAWCSNSCCVSSNS